MSKRDLAHVLAALAEGEDFEGTGVPVAAVSTAIGRAASDMRTPLDLQALLGDGLVEERSPGAWSLTAAGRQRIRDDDELSTQH